MKECHDHRVSGGVAGAQMRGGKAVIVSHPARHRQRCDCDRCARRRLIERCRSPEDWRRVLEHRARVHQHLERGAA